MQATASWSAVEQYHCSALLEAAQGLSLLFEARGRERLSERKMLLKLGEKTEGVEETDWKRDERPL